MTKFISFVTFIASMLFVGYTLAPAKNISARITPEVQRPAWDTFEGQLATIPGAFDGPQEVNRSLKGDRLPVRPHD